MNPLSLLGNAGSGGFGFASSRDYRGEAGDITGMGGTFSAFNSGPTTPQILLIGGLALVALLIWKKKR